MFVFMKSVRKSRCKFLFYILLSTVCISKTRECFYLFSFKYFLDLTIFFSLLENKNSFSSNFSSKSNRRNLLFFLKSKIYKNFFLSIRPLANFA